MAKREMKAKIRYERKGEEAKLTERPDSIRFDFAHGDSFTVDVGSLPKNIREVATVRGVAEKIRDTYAGAETSQEAQETAQEMLERLVAGEWLSEREGGGPRMSMFLEALKRVKGDAFNLEEAHAKYSGDGEVTFMGQTMTKAQARTAALKNPALAKAYDEVRAEAAAKKAAKVEGPAPETADL